MNPYEPNGPGRQVALPANLTLASRDGRLEISWRWSLLGSVMLPARSLEERLVRGLISHGLGYVASTQRVYAVVGHVGWLMLSIIGLQEGASGQVGRLLSSRLLDVYAMLGGVNEHGRGGTAELMAVWGKVALIIYLVGLVLSWARGPRRPWDRLKLRSHRAHQRVA